MSSDPTQGSGDFAGLHVLADDDPRWPLDPVGQARAACAGGASVVQLRAKRATDRQILAWAEEIRGITRNDGVLFFVNDRFDLAWAVAADGVHLGQEDVPPGRIPPVVRRSLRIGRSTHTLAEARAALAEPVDYVAFGPVFGTTSKDSPFSPRGLEQLRDVVACVGSQPVIAIGGINASNAADVVRSGAAGAAVISAVAAAHDAARAAREISSRLSEAAA